MADQPLWDSGSKDSDITLSNGDRTASLATSQNGSARSTTGITSGKYYVELTWTAGTNNPRIGIVKSGQSLANYGPGSNANSWVIVFESGNKQTNGSSVAYGTASSPGDVFMIAYDRTGGKIWFGHNGTWYNSGDPAAGTGEAYSGLTSGTIHVIMGRAGVATGARTATFTALASYSYSAPSGFTAGWGGGTVTPQTLSATLTATASIRRTTTKIVSATSTLTASIRRTIAKTVSATASLTGTIRKTVGKTLSGSLPLTASLTRATVYSRALSATLSLTGGMTRTVEKVVTGTVDLTAGMTRTVGKTLSATVDLTASLARALGVTLVATIDLSASMARTIGKVLTGEISLVPDLGKIKASVVTMSADLTMTATMTAGALFTRVMEATVSLSASMSRTIDKIMTAALPVVSKPIQWVATLLAAFRLDKPNWNQCARCNKSTRPNKLHRQMEYRGPRLVWTGLYVCDLCEDIPQPQGREPRVLGGDPRPVPNARPRKS